MVADPDMLDTLLGPDGCRSGYGRRFGNILTDSNQDHQMNAVNDIIIFVTTIASLQEPPSRYIFTGL